ncbi:hypothetical protein SAMN04487968_103228 [Nocardioides terrae]|uniref:Uncharacterized protein n=1 Tax=Nocardioides terrae TaxID=574651 RepID=A0A1I1G1P8_9ACTN|nr:hypothetical protein [Nocardioides terrae]SFC05759.1 hypothetical protein SAMN04487968_103228 [Nocardioides terrae]
MADEDLLPLADELYALPLAAFTPARDKRAKETKDTRIKALRKPSLAAWVVNLLVRHETEQVEQVLAIGAGLRAAAEGMDAKQLRELTKQRRQLTAAVTTRARAVARERGVRVTEAVADQVEATLTAAILDQGAAEAVRSGLLVTSLAATGVDAVDAAAAVALPSALGFEAAPVSRELRVVPDPEPEEAERRRREEALQAARGTLAEAQHDHAAAAKQVSKLEAKALQLSAELEEARRRVADLEEKAEELDEELAEAEDARDEAAGELAEAQAAVDRLS